MADLPILFSAPMVRALLDGRKTQTRRVLTSYCGEAPAFIEKGAITALDENERPYRWPRTKAVGDRLYVREHWKAGPAYDDLAPRDLGGEECILYLADNTEQKWGWDHPQVYGRHRQGMHMPRWASRITLEVTGVKVERLQACSEVDAVAEGCKGFVSQNGEDGLSPQEEYRDLWNSINGPGAWETNPWVAAYTFRPILGNIDQMPEVVK